MRIRKFPVYEPRVTREPSEILGALAALATAGYQRSFLLTAATLY